MQLKKIGALFLVLLGIFKPHKTDADVTVKGKRLQYKEPDPGIQVDEDAIEVVISLADEDKLSLTYIHDVVTGASPTGLPVGTSNTGSSPSSNLNVTLIPSEESHKNRHRGQSTVEIEDERNSYSLVYNKNLEKGMKGLGFFNYSEENDYISTGFGVGLELSANNNNTALSTVYQTNRDRIIPANNKSDENKELHFFATTLTQIINPTSLVTLGASYSRHTGYLNDPYKKVLVGEVVLDEQRPEVRNGVSAFSEYKIKPFDNLSFGIRYRFYRDDWKLSSHTLELKILQTIEEDWVLSYFFRHYEQTGTFFWQERFDEKNTDFFRSSDNRLSPFSSDTFGMTAIFKLDDVWWLEGSLARYNQFEGRGSKPLIPESDTINSANILSIALQYQFYTE